MVRRVFFGASSVSTFMATGSFRLASNIPLKGLGVADNSSIKSVSKWSWPFCEQFTEIVHDPTLSLPTGTPMWPSAEVFAELKIQDQLLIDPPEDRQVFKHCKIEKVMNRMGYRSVRKRHYYALVLEQSKQMVSQLARARREELSATRYKKRVDQCAEFFFILNGFASDPFDMTAEGSDCKIFDKTCRSDGDHYVAVTPSNDIVLVFEDKSLQFDEVVNQHGHIGQIVGSLLQLLSVNRANKVHGSIFAVRFINYHVTAFRLDVGKRALDDLANNRTVPSKKLQLRCSDASPTKNRGLSLIEPIQRRKALQLMADIRNFIVCHKKVD